MSLEVSNINKFYGDQHVLKDVSFSIAKGEIVGLLGPNGAGKSTLMKIITGYIKSFDGNVKVSTIDSSTQPLETKQRIGYLPEHNPLYLDMYVKEYLNFVAGLYHVSTTEIPVIIEKVGLVKEQAKKIEQLSKGYRQRVGLAAALIHKPEVLILDEPTTGLDPNQLVEIREVIKEVGKNTTILFSTHIMQEVEALCNRVILIHQGKIIADKKLEDFVQGNQQRIIVEFDLKIEEQLLKSVSNLTQCQALSTTMWEITFTTDKDMRTRIFDFAQQNGLKIVQLTAKNSSLESLFRSLTTESVSN